MGVYKFFHIKDKSILILVIYGSHADNGPRRRSLYRDFLRNGRSANWVPVEGRFSAPVQTGPGAYPASSKVGNESLS
jgi:hypothetical protein